MKVQEIINMPKKQLNRLYRNNPKQMRKLANQLFSAANKRIRALEKSPYSIASYEYGIVTGRAGSGKYGTGMFSSKNKSDFKLRQEMERARMFMKSQSSTIMGTKRIIKQTEDRLSKLLGEEFHFKTPQDFKNYWEMVKDYESTYSRVLTAYSSTQVHKLVLSVFKEPNASIEKVEQERNRQYDEEFKDWS